jgi:undecaprenyl-diphosphatase
VIERPTVTARLVSFDRLLLLWVVAHRIEPLNPLMWAISVIGRGGLEWLAIGAGLMFARRLHVRGMIRIALAILLASLCTNQFLKPIVARERPFAVTPQIDVIGRPPLDGSFPSGHSANAFAGAYVLSRLIPAAQVAWWALAIAIAYSRVYLGVHYPSDVAGGAVVGIVSGMVVMALTSLPTRSPPVNNVSP